MIRAVDLACGYKIAELRPVPKIKINSSFKWITDEFRKEVNDWLAANFGYIKEERLKPGEFLRDECNQVIYGLPEDVDMLRKIFNK